MRKDEVIQKLARISGNPVVVILDSEINARNLVGDGSGEGSTDGIHIDYDIQLVAGDQLPKGAKPFIAMVFTAETEPALAGALERLFKIEKTGFFHFICNSGRPSEQITPELRSVLDDLRKFLPNGQ